ncbi:MAG TPA: ATP synthase subunit I [Halothiobacillaceae bacterium]|nr:ATP synthase subunit I [Halothiobacillaceae bacterium]
MIDMAEAITRRGRTIVVVQSSLIVLMAVASVFVSLHAATSALAGGLIAMLMAWMLRRTMTRATRAAVEDPGASMRMMYIGAGMRFFVLLALMAFAIGLVDLDPRFVVGGFVVVLVAGVLAAKGQDSGHPDARGG